MRYSTLNCYFCSSLGRSDLPNAGTATPKHPARLLTSSPMFCPQHACPCSFGIGHPAFVLCMYSCYLTHTHTHTHTHTQRFCACVCVLVYVCHRDAVSAYTEAARLDPRNPVYLSNRALAYLRLFR
jgi:hypothetical protein